MKLLLDASHQRAGGGLQVALGTIASVVGATGPGRCDLLCVEGSPLADYGRDNDLPVLTVADSPLGRVGALVRGRPIHDVRRYDCIYTIFGPPIRQRGDAVNVIGVAYSQLFYPEIDFWKTSPRHLRPAHRARSRLRLAGIRRADAWIFETDVMRSRAIEQLGIEPRRATVIPPAPSPFIRHPEPSSRLKATLAALPDRPRVLLAAGWQGHKNLRTVPGVAKACRNLFGESPLFVFTLEPESIGATELTRLATALGVADDLRFIGRVDQRSIGQALAQVHCVLLLSELESFSNNVIEAFVGGLPLVISDRDWARSACRDGAVYVEPHDPYEVARGLTQAMGERRDSLVARGAALAEELYLSQQARAVLTMNFLTEVHGMGSASKALRTHKESTCHT